MRRSLGTALMNIQPAGTHDFSSNEFLTLMKTIKPVMRFGRGLNGLFPRLDGRLFWIELPEFILDQPLNRHPRPLRACRLTMLALIQMDFPTASSGFFQPTLMQALLQVPRKYLGQATTIEVVTGGEDCHVVDNRYLTLARLYGPIRRRRKKK